MNGLRTPARHALAFLRERVTGSAERYDIRAGYAHRAETIHFDDTPHEDEYQREVYQRAAELANAHNLRTVYDVGCGSGFKLLNYLGDFDTVGFDVPVTLDFLRQEYPDRQWRTASFDDRSIPPADIVICSDVIEHVIDPDALMAFLVALTGRWLVLSTPDRSRAYARFSRYQLGPPSSDHHVREWSMSEFRRYVSRFFDVHEHLHTHPEHSTQMIVGTSRLPCA